MRSSYKERGPEAFFHGFHGNTVYQVSPPCIVWYASLRGEEVVIFKSVLRPFFVDGRHVNAKKHAYQVSPLCIVW